jgi:hypothetical protein
LRHVRWLARGRERCAIGVSGRGVERVRSHLPESVTFRGHWKSNE